MIYQRNFSIYMRYMQHNIAYARKFIQNEISIDSIERNLKILDYIFSCTLIYV